MKTLEARCLRCDTIFYADLDSEEMILSTCEACLQDEMGEEEQRKNMEKILARYARMEILD